MKDGPIALISSGGESQMRKHRIGRIASVDSFAGQRPILVR
jgi:hypothetical protein